MGLESGIGSIGSGLFNLYGQDDPYDAASGYYDKIPGMLNQQYSPWINNGLNALGGLNQYENAGLQALPGLQQYENRGNAAGSQLMNQYNQMTNDPSGLVNRLGAGFHQSPGYAFQTSQALGAANRAAAAGGMAGSPEEQQNIAGVTNQLANQDYYNYLNHSQQLYGQGIQGLQGTERLGAMTGTNIYSQGVGAGQDVYNQGANAANNLAQNLGAAYMNQGNMKMAQAQYNNQRKGQAYGQLWGGVNDIFNPGGQYTGGTGWGGGASGGGSSGGGGGGGLGSMFSGMFGGGSGGGGQQGDSSGGGSGVNMGELAGLAMMLF
jgi:hypothetical protein